MTHENLALIQFFYIITQYLNEYEIKLHDFLINK